MLLLPVLIVSPDLPLGISRYSGAGYKDLEDCLVPKFPKLQTIMVWGCFKGIKYPLHIFIFLCILFTPFSLFYYRVR